jgi:cytochrome P450
MVETAQIEAIADELLDEFDTSAPVDLVKSYAGPLPVRVISELLGIPVRSGFQEVLEPFLQPSSGHRPQTQPTHGVRSRHPPLRGGHSRPDRRPHRHRPAHGLLRKPGACPTGPNEYRDSTSIHGLVTLPVWCHPA